MMYTIDGEKLKRIIHGKALLMKDVGLGCGMSHGYISSAVTRGLIKGAVAIALQERYGIPLEDYIKKEDVKTDFKPEETPDNKSTTELALAISVGVEKGIEKAAELIAETMIDLIDYKKLALAVYYAIDYANFKSGKSQEGESNPIPVIDKEMDGKV